MRLIVKSEKIASIRRLLGYIKWRIRTWLQSRKIAKLYDDVNKVFWISPDRIIAALYFVGERSPISERGVVKAGDWDLKRIEWEDFEAWKAFKHRYLHKGEWAETGWYKSLLNEIQSGTRFVYNCHNKMDLGRHFKETDALYERIKKNGYQMQSERSTEKIISLEFEDEISVHIDRNGHYLFGDGRHRYFIAKLIGLKRVPVKIARRHAEWVKFRQCILNYAAQGNGKIYQPIMHPDLEDIPSSHGHERFELIKSHLPFRYGSVLDLGANWGYFSHRLEDAGFECTAVESFPIELYFLKRLHIAESRNFKIIAKSILDLDGRLEYDVVLALNIFHHFLKDEFKYHRWLDFLERLDTKVFFFEPHLPNEEQMKGSYINYEPEEFANVIAERCRMKRVHEIGRSTDGRPLYVLYK